MTFQHLENKNIGYFPHLIQAWKIAGLMVCSGVACFIHGIYPDIFSTTATDISDYIVKTYGTKI